MDEDSRRRFDEARRPGRFVGLLLLVGLFYVRCSSASSSSNATSSSNASTSSSAFTGPSGASSSSSASIAVPMCGAPQVCAAYLAGDQRLPANFSLPTCLPPCELDAADCPAAQTCAIGIGCCSGSACSASPVQVCVPSATDAGADAG